MKHFVFGLFLVLVLVAAWYWREIRSFGPPQVPLYRFDVSFPKNGEEAFHVMLQDFASDNGFRIRIRPIMPDHSQFSIDLRRPDIRIGLSSPGDGWDYNGGFYRTYQPLPSMDLILELCNDLDLRATAIGVTFRFFDPSEDEQ